MGDEEEKRDIRLKKTKSNPFLQFKEREMVKVSVPKYDGPASWQYLNAVRPIYELHGRSDALCCYDHGTGHQPTEESIRLAYRWLAEQFSLPFSSWSP